MDGRIHFPMPELQAEFPALQPAEGVARRAELDPGSSEVERIFLGIAASSKRVIGVVDCGASGTGSALARALAERGSASGEPTLYLDLAQPARPDGAYVPWLPGDGRSVRSIAVDPRGFDRLTGWTCAKTTMKFRNLGALRQLLDEELAHYRCIVVDAGSMMLDTAAAVPPVTVAQVCDGLIVTATSHSATAAAFKAAMTSLGAARETVIGVVVDDCDNPTVGEQLRASIRHRLRRIPWLALRLGALVERIGLLWERT